MITDMVVKLKYKFISVETACAVIKLLLGLKNLWDIKFLVPLITPVVCYAAGCNLTPKSQTEIEYLGRKLSCWRMEVTWCYSSHRFEWNILINCLSLSIVHHNYRTLSITVFMFTKSVKWLLYHCYTESPVCKMNVAVLSSFTLLP